jgi:adenylate cyclase
VIVSRPWQSKVRWVAIDSSFSARYGKVSMTSPDSDFDANGCPEDQREFTSSEVSEAVGIPMYKARRYWRGLGFANVPDGDREFTHFDIDALSTLLDMVNDGVLNESQAVALTRTLGRSAARLANSVAEGMSQLLDTSEIAGDPLGSALREVSDRLLPGIEELLIYSWRRHFAVAMKRRQSHVSASGPVTIGFADLVAFTRLSRQLSDHELAQLVRRFESRVADLVTSHGGRVIKSLGDEVLFAADEPSIAADIAIDLTEKVSRRSIPGIRVGLEFGSVVHHAGDVFGDTVNLASRLTAMAEPNAIVIGPALSNALSLLTAYGGVKMRTVDSRIRNDSCCQAHPGSIPSNHSYRSGPSESAPR